MTPHILSEIVWLEYECLLRLNRACIDCCSSRHYLHPFIKGAIVIGGYSLHYLTVIIALQSLAF